MNAQNTNEIDMNTDEPQTQEETTRLEIVENDDHEELNDQHVFEPEEIIHETPSTLNDYTQEALPISGSSQFSEDLVDLQVVYYFATFFVFFIILKEIFYVSKVREPQIQISNEDEEELS